ncbi:hypothetical protein CH329_04355 [Mycoplasmopsis bovis]|nr:hypothetical protein CH329_04355 [Mycoplasmopsis bovis]
MFFEWNDENKKCKTHFSYVSQFKHKTRKHNYVNFWSHKLCFFYNVMSKWLFLLLKVLIIFDKFANFLVTRRYKLV